MVITPTPISLPTSTANVPTEAVANQNTHQERIPETLELQQQPPIKANVDTNSNLKQIQQQAQALRTTPPTPSASEQTDTNELIPESQERINEEQNNQSNNNAQENSQEKAEQERVAALKRRDQEVRNHEAAHARTGGQYAGTPEFTYVKGPDNILYAVEGEVPIDISEVPNDPEATVAKMEQVVRAALAPANPSAQDQRVASKASVIASEARAEIEKSKREENIEQRELENAEKAEKRAAEKEEKDDEISQNQFSISNQVQNIPKLIQQTGAVDINDINTLIGAQFNQSA